MDTLVFFAAVIAGAVVLDWACFWRITNMMPLTSAPDGAYKDYFFPRVIFIVLAGVLIASGANLTGEPAHTLLILGGTALFIAANGVQYYWFWTD